MPTPWPKLPSGVRRLFRLPGSRDRMLREMDDEIRTHLAMRIEYLRARDMSEAEAEAEALRRFGDTRAFRVYAAHRAARRSRRLRVTQWMAGWAEDARFATRQLAKAPAFTGVAVVTLALAIGANTALFSVVHRLLLDPLPFPRGDRIVVPVEDGGPGGVRAIDGPLFDAWRERARSVDMIAWAWDVTFGARDDGTVEHVPNGGMTPNFLATLGLQPALGRTFTTEEALARDARVAMIGYGRWQRDFAGSTDAIGSTLEFEGRTYTIVGVTPRGLFIPFSPKPTPEIWLPALLHGGCCLVATLRPGVSAEMATRELRSIAEAVPEPARGRTGLRVMRPQDFLDARATRSVEVLLVAVGALLLIACANVANLLLARAWTRRREFAVRRALGAGSGRLARQVLTESVLLAVAGGALGVAVAWQTLRIVIALRPPALSQLDDVRIHATVLLWSLGLSIASGILFGSLPAIMAGARRAADVLRSESRAGSPGLASGRVRSGLIVLEIATSLVLLVSAGLLVRSFIELQRMPLGFEPHGLAQVTVITGPHNRGRELAVGRAIVDRLRGLPGVAEVAIGTMPGQGFFGGGLESEPDATGRSISVPAVAWNPISPHYLRVARIALVEGRLPDSATTLPADRSPFALSSEVMVNRSLARRLWPDGPAVGSRVRRTWEGPLPPGDASVEPWTTVVGIVDDVRLPELRSDLRAPSLAHRPGGTAPLHFYTLQNPRMSNIPFLVRTAGRGEDALPAMERAVKADPTVLFYGSQSGEQYLRDALAPTRFAMTLLTAFAIVALVLASVGLYGVIAYGVTRRTREIGVRMALGADPKAVTRLVVGGGARLTAIGVAIGAVIAVGATRLLGSMLYAVRPTDPSTFAAIALLVAAIATVASCIPVRRALRIDPSEALRAD